MLKLSGRALALSCFPAALLAVRGNLRLSLRGSFQPRRLMLALLSVKLYREAATLKKFRRALKPCAVAAAGNAHSKSR